MNLPQRRSTASRRRPAPLNRERPRPGRFRPNLEYLEGRCLPSTFTVVNASDHDPGSLREAIQNANAASDTVTIAFNIPGTGVHTIALTSALPAITHPVTIDGTTQPGYAGSPLIELNGAGAGANADGLIVRAGSSTVRALAVNRFAGSGIRLENSGSNQILNNRIGTDAGGTQALGNRNVGVVVATSSPQNTISGNVISDNLFGGVRVSGRLNVVQNNDIGTNATATVALGNIGQGVFLDGPDTTLTGNVISGNLSNGVEAAAGADRTRLQGNVIGLDGRSSRALGNGSAGVSIASSNNTVGGTTTSARNVISGNQFDGIFVNGAPATGNVLQGNFIGTTPGGGVFGNGGEGIYLGSPNNTVGGTPTAARNTLANNDGSGLHVTGGGNLILNNVISANTNGVTVDYASSNTISGNVIQGNLLTGLTLSGPRTTGNQLVGNQIGAVTATTHPNAVGVLISNGAVNNTVGGTAAGSRNVISGNTGSGVLIANGASGNLVLGNYLGTGVSGTNAQPNDIGVDIRNAPGNTVGGATPPARNLISGNTHAGVQVAGLQSVGNIIQGNYIGTSAFGTTALANGAGIRVIDNAHLVTIGGAALGAGNLISGNVREGIALISTSTQDMVSDVTIQGNLIGTNATGTAALGNMTGIFLQQNPGVTIGGTTAGARNLISGNDAGIVAGLTLTSATVQGNYIGTDTTGTQAIPNHVGIDLQATGLGNLIGGTVAGARNLVSGNDTGLSIHGAPDEPTLATVQGNYIGTDVTGLQALPNGVGVALAFSTATVGSQAPEGRNVISGNTTAGIIMNGDRGSGRGNSIVGNLIGTDVTGASALGNGLGIGLTNTAFQAITGNVIAANFGDGIQVSGGNGNVQIQGNLIGEGLDGSPQGNGGNGVTLTNSSNNTVTGNSIGYNGNDGVLVDTGIANLIQGNSILGDGNLGIELVNGGNLNQPYPVLTSAVSDGVSTTTVQGTLSAVPNTTYVLEFFDNAACNPSGFGEGELSLGTVQVTTDDQGQASFTVDLDFGVAPGDFITATATDPGNDTSAFSACQVVTGPGSPGRGIGVRENPGYPPAATESPKLHSLPAPAKVSEAGGRTAWVEEVTALARVRREAADLLFAELNRAATSDFDN